MNQESYDRIVNHYSAHQKAYLAHRLSIRGRADVTLPRTLAGARVDMNPHQVEAALFALRSPLERGALLADEVGLGKTIEAGLVIAQRWAEHQRHVLLIVPATLRKQWAQELWDKFDLSAYIIEAGGLETIRAQGETPNHEGLIAIVSYEFAARHCETFRAIAWDLVVFDEAHRLRNVYRNSGNKTAKTLNEAFQNRYKLLLSATPLQNSLLELYGLVSVIDPHFFGNEQAFRSRYVLQRTDPDRLRELHQRMRRIAKRTLRRQVQAAGLINFTRRYSITEDFRLTPEEDALYQGVSDYLRDGCVHAIRPNARHLVILVLRKILASSSFAIGETLGRMAQRLEQRHAASTADLNDYETADEWGDGEKDTTQAELSPDERDALRGEIERLQEFRAMAEGIRDNAKGLALVRALNKAFEMTERLGGPRKAVIFTESRRTQRYLKEKLEAEGYAGQLVLMNGGNADPASKAIYRNWLERHEGSGRISGSKNADTKAAIVEEFRDRATLLIATESGAEGVNLQFCSLVINYDLPWNPQRVEQRIGRVHRYGQRHDVVVVNFLNKDNRADELVFELLGQKFKLFEGVFGASDEVLGAIESGVDIEQRIGRIYQQCREPQQIEAAFEELREELSETLAASERDARRAVLENLDSDVVAKLRTRRGAVRKQLTEHQDDLLCLVRVALPEAEFHEDHLIHEGVRYDVDWHRANEHDAQFLRINEGLGERLIEQAKAGELPPARLIFDYARLDQKYSDLEYRFGQSGHLAVELLDIEGAEREQHLLLAAYTDCGDELPEESIERLMKIPCLENRPTASADQSRLDSMLSSVKNQRLREASDRNERFFEEESEKLDRWAQDQRETMDQTLKRMDDEIREAKKALRGLPTLAEKARAKRDIKTMETRRDNQMLAFHETRRQITEREDQLLDEVEGKLQMTHTRQRLFTIQWKLVQDLANEVPY